MLVVSKKLPSEGFELFLPGFDLRTFALPLVIVERDFVVLLSALQDRLDGRLRDFEVIRGRTLGPSFLDFPDEVLSAVVLDRILVHEPVFNIVTEGRSPDSLPIAPGFIDSLLHAVLDHLPFGVVQHYQHVQ